MIHIPAKIPALALVSAFRTMLDEHWAYAPDTRRGQVDCSGAFVWAYAQHGRSIYHGSNRIARREVEALIPIAEATLVPGMAAFKRRDPTEPGYALPTAYRPGGSQHTGDLGDYYHIGLIDRDTTRVLNAQSAATGFVASPVTQHWTHVARLRQVSYDQQEVSPMTMHVTADNGKPVNVRKSPSATAARLTQLPVGTAVEVRALEGDWALIASGATVGYMMRAFLTAAPTVEERLEALEYRVAALEEGAAP